MSVLFALQILHFLMHCWHRDQAIIAVGTTNKHYFLRTGNETSQEDIDRSSTELCNICTATLNRNRAGPMHTNSFP
jgi:hypothetical protein